MYIISPCMLKEWVAWRCTHVWEMNSKGAAEKGATGEAAGGTALGVTEWAAAKKSLLMQTREGRKPVKSKAKIPFIK